MISEIKENPRIAPSDKRRIVSVLTQTQALSERHEETSRGREQQLEIMSLLGIVAGFMTHEFGVAIKDLEDAKKELDELSKIDSRFKIYSGKFSSILMVLYSIFLSKRSFPFKILSSIFFALVNLGILNSW